MSDLRREYTRAYSALRYQRVNTGSGDYAPPLFEDRNAEQELRACAYAAIGAATISLIDELEGFKIAHADKERAGKYRRMMLVKRQERERVYYRCSPIAIHVGPSWLVQEGE